MPLGKIWILKCRRNDADRINWSNLFTLNSGTKMTEDYCFINYNLGVLVVNSISRHMFQSVGYLCQQKKSRLMPMVKRKLVASCISK